MADVAINRQAIARMTREIQREFDKYPIRMPVQANPPVLPDGLAGTTTTIFNGPVFHGSADGAQLAWGNQAVDQTQNRTEHVTPGFEAIAHAVVKTLEGPPGVGLAEDDHQDAQAAARDILAEVTVPEPDRGKIRRGLSSLKGFLAPVAMGLVTGSAEGVHEWARMAIEQLGRPF